MTETCPHCATRLRRHMDLVTRHHHANGDYTLCVWCGHWGVFDDHSPGGMRLPSLREQRWLDANPRAAAMVSGWRLWRRNRQT